MSFGEQMKQKADEVHLQEKAKDFGDAVAEMVKATVGIVAGYASQNREKVDVMLDKAETTIDEKTGGKHTVTVTKVRTKVDESLDKLAEQSGKAPGAPAGTTSAAGGFPGEPAPSPTSAGPTLAETSTVPGMQGAAATHGMGETVPDDTTSAFDDDTPSGSPS